MMPAECAGRSCVRVVSKLKRADGPESPIPNSLQKCCHDGTAQSQFFQAFRCAYAYTQRQSSAATSVRFIASKAGLEPRWLKRFK